MTQKTHVKKKSTIVSEKTVKPKSDTTKHYVDNVKFFNELILWRTAAHIAKTEEKPRPKIPEFIGECIFKICERLSTVHYFRDYTYRDEMVNNAIENCIRKLENFNPEVTTNPFAYFSQIAYFSFLGTIDSEKKEAYVKYKSIIERLTSSDLAASGEEMSVIAEHAMDNNVDLQIDHMEQYVDDFEKKLKAKKVPKPPKVVETQDPEVVS